MRDDRAAVAADPDTILVNGPALHDQVLAATFKIFLHQLAIHLDDLTDARGIQKLGLVASMHISRRDILGFEETGVLRHNQDRMGYGTAKRGVLYVPRMGVLDAFGIVPRQLGGENVLVSILFPDVQIFKNHGLLVIHTDMLLMAAYRHDRRLVAGEGGDMSHDIHGDHVHRWCEANVADFALRW
jgi:hypothetical protein